MKPWTTEEFRAAAIAMFGNAHGWQSALGRALNVTDRTVRRWASGHSPVPEKIQREIMRMAGIEDESGFTWPRDEWIVGDGSNSLDDHQREYIIHTKSPRFIARAAAMDPETGAPAASEGSCDMLSGVTYDADSDVCLCEIQWIDRPPSGAMLYELLEQAALVLERS